MSRKIWKIKTVAGDAASHLAGQLELPTAIARVLVQRGFQDPDAAREFMNPRLASLADPCLLPDMGKAVERIWKSIRSGESITVFGDYDVDGVTAAALLLRVLSELGANAGGFVPDRMDEGYGLSPDALERCLEEQEPNLLISVDCGTNSVESIVSAQERGIDVVVTDHHVPAEKTAPAFALINPKLGCGGEHLSGVGVVFKLAHALVKSGREAGDKQAMETDLRRYLDIVALGTVADIVPLVGDNRIIVRHGLAQLENTHWAGMKALKRVAAIRGEPDTGQLGFQLGPRINAAGRIGEPMQAVRLLTTDDPDEAQRIAELLDRTNRERRSIEQEIADRAFAEIDTYFKADSHFGLVVAGEGWHPGVVGIVASRITNRYGRPAVVLGIEEDGSARGSCRSIEEFDMLAALQDCERYLTKFGGHRMAAGVEVESGALESFRDAFNLTAAAALKDIDLSPAQDIDAVVTPAELGWPFYESLRRLRPFGQDNAEPVWALKGMRPAAPPRVVGHKHLKLRLAAGNRVFDAIAFNCPLSSLPDGAVDAAFTLKENTWNGNTSLQLVIQDIRAAE